MNRTIGTKQTRRRSNAHYTRSVLRQVWQHPSNRHRRLRALTRSICWQIYKRIIGRPITITFGTMKIRCHPDAGSTSNVIYFTERFDPVEFDFLDHFLREGDEVVDVGANVGLYALWMAQAVGPSGHVDAFEAAPTAFSRLRENVALNGLDELISLHQAAASSTTGSLQFSIDYDVSNAIVSAESAQSRPIRTVEVEAVALDQVLPGTYVLAKIDVEGAEAAVLDGWQDTLTAGNVAVLVMELLPNQLVKQGESMSGAFTRLDGLGFDLVEYDADTRTLLRADAATADPGNMLFVHRSQRARVDQRLGEHPDPSDWAR